MNDDGYKTIFESPIGHLIITFDAHYVKKIEWQKQEESDVIRKKASRSSIAEQVSMKLEEYFMSIDTEWNLPLASVGTAFQKKVWQYLQSIPRGETRYYSEVAKALNSSAQAVGNACRTNPFVIVIPCHRVISKQGIGGYDGETSGNNIKIKQWLLDHERY